MLRKLITVHLRHIANVVNPDGEVKKKVIETPQIKPQRRQPSFKNISDRSDYSQKYMEKYRSEGKDYQKVPDSIKEYRKEQKQQLQEHFKKQV